MLEWDISCDWHSDMRVKFWLPIQSCKIKNTLTFKCHILYWLFWMVSLNFYTLFQLDRHSWPTLIHFNGLQSVTCINSTQPTNKQTGQLVWGVYLDFFIFKFLSSNWKLSVKHSFKKINIIFLPTCTTCDKDLIEPRTKEWLRVFHYQNNALLGGDI